MIRKCLTNIHKKFQRVEGVKLPLLLFLVVVLSSTLFLPKAEAVQRTKKVIIDDIYIGELELKEAKVQDAVRVISEMTGVNIICTVEAGERFVTLFVRNLSVSDVVDSVCRITGLWYRHNIDTDVFIIMTTEEYERDIVVYRDEPTKMFQLKYLNVGIAARTIADLFGERVELQGAMNEQYGDDFKVGEALGNFTVNYESVGGDDEDEDDENNNDRSTSNQARKIEDVSLSPTQIQLLESAYKAGFNRYTEEQLGEVDQREESPIYVSVNRLHNRLFVRTADEKALKEIEKIIKHSDQQVPEVLLEMKVLAVTLNDNFQSAFDIAFNGGDVRADSGTFTAIDGATFGFGVMSKNIEVQMELLEQNNNVHTLATPILLAANNQPAKLFIGEETILTTGFEVQDIDTGGSDNYYYTVPVPVTEKRQVGNTLNILPSINADRSVVLRIIHENSAVKNDGAEIPLLVGNKVENVKVDTVDTSKVEGTAIAMDGMTVALGGMIRTSYTDSEEKVPILGDIPGLGFFFKSQKQVEAKTELILLITPHVLTSPIYGEGLTHQRMDDLLEQSGPLDGYFGSLDESRGPEEQRRLMKGLDSLGGAPMALKPDDTSYLEKSFVDMTKIAVNQVRKPMSMRKVEGGVKPLSLDNRKPVKIYNDTGVRCTPEGSWTDGYYYVTAVKVENLTKKKKSLDLGKLIGNWQAATVETRDLEVEGKDGDYTYLYLVSKKKFDGRVPLMELN